MTETLGRDRRWLWAALLAAMAALFNAATVYQTDQVTYLAAALALAAVAGMAVQLYHNPEVDHGE